MHVSAPHKLPAVLRVENVALSNLAKGGHLAHGDQAFDLGLRCRDGNDFGLGGQRPLGARPNGDDLDGGFEREGPSAAIGSTAGRVFGSRSQAP